MVNDLAKELCVSTDRLRLYHGGNIVFQLEDPEQGMEDDGDEFGKILRLPPALGANIPATTDPEEGMPLPASTETT